MARAHEGDNPVPSEMVMDVGPQVSSKTVVYGEKDGKKLSGYLATPEKRFYEPPKPPCYSRMVGIERQYPLHD